MMEEIGRREPKTVLPTAGDRVVELNLSHAVNVYKKQHCELVGAARASANAEEYLTALIWVCTVPKTTIHLVSQTPRPV